MGEMNWLWKRNNRLRTFYPTHFLHIALKWQYFQICDFVPVSCFAWFNLSALTSLPKNYKDRSNLSLEVHKEGDVQVGKSPFPWGQFH